MTTKVLWILAGTMLAYLAGLIAALYAGGEAVQVAVIAVGGTAIGAVAGAAGSLAGGRAQAEETRAAAIVQTDAERAIKQIEVNAVRDAALLQQRLRWVETAYNELRELLRLSRDLGVRVTEKATYHEVIVEIQSIDTSANLLAANPIIGVDENLRSELRNYVGAISRASFDDWKAAHGESRGPLPTDWVPPGQLGTQLADHVRVRLSEVTAVAGI